MIPQLKIGSDPEMFVHIRGRGLVAPSEFNFPGDKKNPYAVSHGALQIDGLAAELNTLPALTEDEFVENFNNVLKAARTFLPEDASFIRVPAVTFKADYMKSLPEKMKEIGCDPDFNAWEEGDQNPIPTLGETVRVAGGHIHLGFGEDFNPFDPIYHRTVCELVKQLDCLVGAWDTINEVSSVRKQSYGKAGAFRFKSYGVEYRTPSNRWTVSEYTTRLIFKLTKKAYEDYHKGNLYYEKYPEIREVVNGSDKKEAKRIYNAVLNS